MNKAVRSILKKRTLWIVIIAVFVIISIGGIRLATFARPPLPEAIAALDNDAVVAVTAEPWLVFSPAQTSPTTGFIFYPGGRIDPRGYAPLMREIASRGYLVVVPEMPLNMAVFNPNIAGKIIENYPNINHWVMAGHSVGGTMAAQYTDNHQDVIDGLMIWASYPSGNADLSGIDIPVVSIFGSLDPRVNEFSVADRKDLLPDTTRYIRIEGGDHHQFGSYETKPENDHATISRASQHDQIVAATVEILQVIARIE